MWALWVQSQAIEVGFSQHVILTSEGEAKVLEWLGPLLRLGIKEVEVLSGEKSYSWTCGLHFWEYLVVSRKVLPSIWPSLYLSSERKKMFISLLVHVGMMLGAVEDSALILILLLSGTDILLFWGGSPHRHIWAWCNSHGTDGHRTWRQRKNGADLISCDWDSDTGRIKWSGSWNLGHAGILSMGYFPHKSVPRA